MCLDIALCLPMPLITNCFLYPTTIFWIQLLSSSIHSSVIKIAFGSGQIGDGKSERSHSRNQQTKMDFNGEFNSDDHYIYYCGQKSLRSNGVAIIDNKRIRNAVLGCNLKNDIMISVHFQGKPFKIMVIQVYAPTSNTEEAEVEWFPG